MVASSVERRPPPKAQTSFRNTATGKTKAASRNGLARRRTHSWV